MIVHLDFPPGLNWLLGYWLLVSAAGVVFVVLNIRISLVQLAAIRSNGAGLRVLTVLGLLLHVVTGLFLAPALAVGLLGLGFAWRLGMHLTFSDLLSAVIVIGLALGLVSGPAMVAALLWLRHNLTMRSIKEAP